MKKGAKKKMAIDDLAVMVAKGFEEASRNTARIENNLIYHIGIIKDKLEGTNKRIDDLAETKVSKIAHKELENRVGFVEKKLEIKK